MAALSYLLLNNLKDILYDTIKLLKNQGKNTV
jgi:hypothetical protein